MCDITEPWEEIPDFPEDQIQRNWAENDWALTKNDQKCSAMRALQFCLCLTELWRCRLRTGNRSDGERKRDQENEERNGMK